MTSYPPFTAAMAADPVEFISTQFLIKDELTGQPRLIELEPFQVELLRDAYPPELDGHPRARNGLYATVKKAGKSTLLAALAMYHAVRKMNAEVYILATTRDQARAVLFDKVRDAIQMHPTWSKYAREVSNSIEFPTLGSVIKAVPNNWRAIEGFFPDAVFVDELHAFTVGSDRRAFDALVIPPQKRGIRWLTSYAGFEGESVLLRQYWNMALEGAPQHPTLPIRYNKAASLWSFVDQGSEAWRMPWMAGEQWEAYLASLQADPSPTAYLRFALNQWASSEQRFVEIGRWDDLEVREVTLAEPGQETRPFVLAADAAVKRDSTALVGAAYNPDLDRVEIVYSQVWEPELGEFDLRVLGAEIVRIHRNYPGLLVGVHYDPYQMAVIGDLLKESGVPVAEFTQTTRRTQADTNLRDLIMGKRLAHLGDGDLRAHMQNAVAKETSRGLRLVKEKTTLKIDGAVACSMAALAAVEDIRFSSAMVADRNPFYL